ncbi:MULTISPECIES: TetR/AcrR family transcriptional regulator [unclassified Ruegeria]|uniref:TetR/AcrR family transcriptional regulator n=1 Tax=unclassified Ruegeria TaxID=2625375 RepID=UPI001488A069|nr:MULTISPECIES: TetR/AcrR family transcriptional regulator [unclassified Ruegeria]
MQKTVQKRTLKTRARLLDAATELVSQGGYEALRVEDVVKSAGVAKGTFFAHFQDKDALMAHLIGEKLAAIFDQVEQDPEPGSVTELIQALAPVHDFMTSERYVFDLLIRYSGAAAITEIGPIARCFERYVRVVETWLNTVPARRDVTSELLAEGVQAFAIQAMALTFCALHGSERFQDRLDIYLKAWLTPAA